MGTRGPLPKPGSSESLRGRNTLRRKTKTPKPSAVTIPAMVKADRVAAAWWKANAPALIKARRLRPELGEAFGLMCLLKSEMDSAAAALALEEMTTTSDKGSFPNALVKIVRDKRRDWLALARDFGMTAASDARIPLEETDAKEADPKAAKFRTFIGA
jgi:phage terminase small subunit